MTRLPMPRINAPIASTKRGPIRSVSRPAYARTSTITVMRSVIAAVKSVRAKPSSASIGFINTENVIEDAVWALIETTPMTSAVHAAQLSPNGPVPARGGLYIGDGMGRGNKPGATDRASEAVVGEKIT